MILFAQDGSGILTFIVGAAVVILIAILAIVATNAAQKRDGQLQALARKLGGRLQTGSLFSFPELRFPHRGLTVTFKYTPGGENESTKTHLTIPWPNGRLRCEIFLEGPLSGLRKLMGMQDIEIGSPHFDRQFIITGNDEAAIKAFLTPDAQARVLDLLRYGSSTSYSTPDLYLQISGGLLTVTKASYLTDRHAIEGFIQLFLQFFEAANSVSSAGIEFLDRPTDAGDAAPHCIVCGEPLTTDLVTCRTCRTPHHRDCWQYFGGCATYACGGKQFVPAKASRGS
jgi:hypothetical protein